MCRNNEQWASPTQIFCIPTGPCIGRAGGPPSRLVGLQLGQKILPRTMAFESENKHKLNWEFPRSAMLDVRSTYGAYIPLMLRTCTPY